MYSQARNSATRCVTAWAMVFIRVVSCMIDWVISATTVDDNVLTRTEYRVSRADTSTSVRYTRLKWRCWRKRDPFSLPVCVILRAPAVGARLTSNATPAHSRRRNVYAPSTVTSWCVWWLADKTVWFLVTHESYLSALRWWYTTLKRYGIQIPDTLLYFACRQNYHLRANLSTITTCRCNLTFLLRPNDDSRSDFIFYLWTFFATHRHSLETTQRSPVKSISVVRS